MRYTMPRNRHLSSVALMNSGEVQRVVLAAANRALATFRRVAGQHSLTGQYAASGHLSRHVENDGRQGYRLEARRTRGNEPIPIETGTSDTPAVGALRAARRAAGRTGPPRRRAI